MRQLPLNSFFSGKKTGPERLCGLSKLRSDNQTGICGVWDEGTVEGPRISKELEAIHQSNVPNAICFLLLLDQYTLRKTWKVGSN